MNIGFSQDGAADYFSGLIDEVALFDRALSAEEAAALYDMVANPSIVLPNIHLNVSEDSILVVGGDTPTMLGSATIDGGKTLTIQGTSKIEVNDLSGGNDATIDVGNGAELVVLATLLPGSTPARLNTQAMQVSIAEGATYAASIDAGTADFLDFGGSVSIANGTTLRLDIDPAHPFTAGTYTLIEARGEDQLNGQFENVIDLGYYTPGGVLSDGTTLTVTVERDLHPGDANLDTTTDVRDFNVWNTNKFTSGTDWASGDFNGDGTTDVRDFNVWNTSKFTSAVAPGAPVAGGQVPEPHVLALLVCSLLVGLLARRGCKTRIDAD